MTDANAKFVTKPNFYTLSEAQAQVRSAMAVRSPDFIYQENYGQGACQYEVDGQPACLLGVAWRTAGYDGSFEEFNQEEFYATPLYTYYTEAAREFLTSAQELQDGGSSWANAYSLSSAHVEELMAKGEIKGDVE